MAEPGPSRSAAIARPTLDHLGVAGAPSNRPNPSLSNASYITSSTSGGTVNNVNGNLLDNSVNNYYGISSTTPSPSLPPFNDAPIDRISSCFTGREPELDFLTTSFMTFQSDKPTRCVIYGMPGLGKSQLALQHANLAFTADVYSHVFCVSATTVEKLSQGLARILGLVNHADRNHQDQAVQITAVRLWLEQSNHHGCRRWLLLFDNVTAESAKFLREHLPRQNASGTILMTTRTRSIAESVANVAGQEHLVFELKALSKVESVGLLLRKAGIQSSALADLESAEKFVSRIGCLPLAVEQAGSFMKRSGFKNANQLQRMYDESGLKEVIHWENNLTTHEATSISSLFTVQLQQLAEIDPDAHKLLKMLAFLDPENIPIDILSLGAQSISDRLARNAERSLTVSLTPKRKVPAIRRLFKKLKGKQQDESVPDTIEETDTASPLEGVPSELTGLIVFVCSAERMRAAFRHFEDISIAQPLYNNEKPSLHIHDLIQWVLQQSSTLIRQEEGYRALAIALLCNAFDTIDDPESPQSWDECERFVPHFTALGTQDGTRSVISGEYLIANRSIAKYFISRGRYHEAETLLVRVLAHRRRLLGSQDIGTLHDMHSLAGVYENLGRYEKAESLYLPLIVTEEKQFGADHLETLATVSNLAGLYKSRGKLDEAESLYARALAGQEKQLGADHPSTLTTIHNLADLYESQGKLDEAESLYARVLAGEEKQLGADHPSTLITVKNLADLYETQRKLGEAESLYARALAGQEKQLGADHPSTLITVDNLAYLRYRQGRQPEAEVLYRRALAGQEAKLGTDHPDTQMTLGNLAAVLEVQGRYQEAEVLRERMN